MTAFTRSLPALLAVALAAVVLFAAVRARRLDRAAVAPDPAPAPVAESPQGLPQAPEPPVAPTTPTPPPATSPPPTLETLAVVSGRLVDDASGQPIIGAHLVFRRESAQRGPQAPITAETTSDNGGAFAVPGVPSGGYLRVAVDKPGYLADVIDARVPRQVDSFDVGTVRMIRGDWRQKIGGGPRGLIGLDHELRDGRVLITKVRPGTSAERAGLKVGERIVSAGGKSMDQLPHAARTYHLQGKAGTRVNVLIESPGGSRREVVLERQQVPGVPDVPTFY